MKFCTLDEYKNNKENITILYPGAFKPISGAHLNLINKYLNYPNVKSVVLFISPGKRDNISVSDAFNIAKHVLKSKPVKIVLDYDSYSPILSVYRWIEKKEREPGKYALASSKKEEDYTRVKEFSKNYSIDKFGKNLPDGVKIIELPIDVSPLLYANGKDKGKPISSTRIREDLKNNDYDAFKENYPNVNEKIIKYIWKTLKKKEKVKNIEEAGNEEHVQQSTSNYERVYPSQKYKSIKNVYDND
jgi:hypothetical protein